MEPLIVANWKMNPTTIAEAKRLFNLVKNGIKKIKKAEVVVCSPFLYVSNLRAQNANLKLGGQNCFWEKEGAYTGEVSPKQLSNLGCKYVIIGHSERRKYFTETDEVVNRKLKATLKTKLTPILCIGETEKQREQGKTETILKKQLEGALKGISSFKIQGSRFCIAYEPVWAIGTGNPCDIEEAQKMGLLIRKIVSGLCSSTISKKIRILYGGSVNSKNAAGYIKEAGFQGLLVGGASLSAKEFVQIVKNAI
jgi:triosephosphate isomerase